MGDGDLIDSMIRDGLWDVYNRFHMGEAAELCADTLGISRDDQDRLAATSYRRALKHYNEASSGERSFRCPCRNGTEQISWWRKMKSQSA